MSRVYADAIEPRKPTQDITLGTAGETITLPGNDLRVNTVKDKGGNTLWTSDGSGNLSSVSSGFSQNSKLLSTQTASNNTDVAFTTQLTSTYDLYCFKWIECQSVSDETSFSFNGSDDTSSHVYNVSKVSSFYFTWNAASGGSPALTQWSTGQLGRGTGYQRLNMGTDDVINRPAASCSGELWLFEPANTTKITHWISVGTGVDSTPGVYGVYTGGYFDIAGAITAINFQQWSPSTGFNGTIKLYGIL